ncbi:hypothetical protein ACVOMV_34495 [Mesorhizobium atlanticum]
MKYTLRRKKMRMIQTMNSGWASRTPSPPRPKQRDEAYHHRRHDDDHHVEQESGSAGAGIRQFHAQVHAFRRPEGVSAPQGP